MNSTVLDQFLYRVGENNPRYLPFMAAAGINGRITKPQTLYESLMLRHGARINLYKLYWSIYLNQHWFKLTDDNPKPVTVNYAGSMMDKHTHFLMNKGFLIESDFLAIEKFIQKNWRLNNGGLAEHNVFGESLAIQGGITGDSWIFLSQAIDPLSGDEYTKYEILDSLKCFPVFDDTELRGLLYYGLTQKVVNENFGFATYRDAFQGYYLSPGNKQIIADDSSSYTEQYDILDLPVVYIPNMKLILSNYGVSDMINLVQLNKTYNEILTQINEVIKYHASPVTILKGASAKQLIKQPNRVWSLPKDAEIDNLELTTDLGATVKHLENVRNAIAEMGKVPMSVFGEKQAISNTTGVAMAIQYMPLYEVMEYKRIMYGIGLMKLTEMTIKYAFIRGLLSPQKIIKDAIAKWENDFSNYDDIIKEKHYPFDKKIDPNMNYDSYNSIIGGLIPRELFQSYITWFPPLPRDEKVGMDMALAGVNSKLYPRRYARSIIGIPEKDSLMMDKEIENELNNPAYTETVTMTNKTIPPKTGMENNADVKGNNESIRRSNA